MAKREPNNIFVENRYRWLAKHAKSDATRLRATDRLAVIYDILKIDLVDQREQNAPPTDIKVSVPMEKIDLDKDAEEMLRKLGGANGGN